MGHSGSKEDIEFVCRVGKGFFGEVFKAQYRGSKIKSLKGKDAPKYVAVKQVNKALIEEYDLQDQLQREIEILRSVSHPNVIKLYFSWEDETSYYIVMEFVASNLFEELRSEKKFSPEKAVKFFVGVVHAVKYLHEHNVMHRDIKPENILVAPAVSGASCSDKVVKIADFGWSNMLAQDEGLRNTFCGTVDYLAPEMIQSAGHTYSVDVWSLGILLYELLCGKSPFGAATQEETCLRILKLEVKWYPSIPENAKDLILGLLKVDPKERISVDSILKHPFILENTKSSVKTITPGLPKTQNIAPATQEANPVADSCGSIEVRRLNKCIKVLEQEVQQVVKSKANTDEKLMSTMFELDTVMATLKDERKQRQNLEKRVASLSSKLSKSQSGLANHQSISMNIKRKSDCDNNADNASVSTLSGSVSNAESRSSENGGPGSSNLGGDLSESCDRDKFRSTVLSEATRAMLDRLKEQCSTTDFLKAAAENSDLLKPNQSKNNDLNSSTVNESESSQNSLCSRSDSHRFSSAAESSFTGAAGPNDSRELSGISESHSTYSDTAVTRSDGLKKLSQELGRVEKLKMLYGHTPDKKGHRESDRIIVNAADSAQSEDLETYLLKKNPIVLPRF